MQHITPIKEREQAMTRQHVIRPGATLIQPYTIPEQRLPIDKPVVQYIRQSSRKQRKHNKASSDMQDVNMRNNLLAMKWTPELILPAIVTDTGMSGTKRADEREGLTQLYWLIDTGGVGTVAAHNVSRIY